MYFLPFNQKGAIPLLLLVGLVAIVGLLTFIGIAPFKDKLLTSIFPKDNSLAANVIPMPIISRGVPAFASSGIAGQGNDSGYTTYWISNGTGWLAYDLSSIPAAKRGRIIATWANDPNTRPYQHTYATVNEPANNLPGDYTIQANSAAGGASAPTAGWITLAAVTGNKYHSRSHQIDLTGYNWIRINVTAVNGSTGNMNVNINMDIYDASVAVDDSWIFYGDSIIQDGMHHEPIAGIGNFAQLINAASPNYFPSFEDAGIWSAQTSDGAAHIGTGNPNWLATFPGKYVALSYGANDANKCVSTATFYNNYKAMVDAVLAAGKIPIVSKMAKSPYTITCGQALIDQIDILYANYPQIIKGPDFWTNPVEISADNTHPSAAGYAAMRQAWASTMLENIYNAGTTPPSPPIPSMPPSPSPSSTPVPSVKPGDIDGNNKVDIFDYNILLTNFGKTGTNVQGDLDKNNKVDIFDYNILLTNFGK